VFVAQFIGTPPMNLLAAKVADGMLRTSSFALPIAARFRDALTEGQAITLGIRPEHISANGTINAIVDVVEPIGHESIVYASAGSEKLVAIFDPHLTPRAGETIALTIDADKVHVFDAATERNLG
jgi:multiple sugar transport system ATP-binding protein